MRGIYWYMVKGNITIRACITLLVRLAHALARLTGGTPLVPVTDGIQSFSIQAARTLLFADNLNF